MNMLIKSDYHGYVIILNLNWGYKMSDIKKDLNGNFAGSENIGPLPEGMTIEQYQEELRNAQGALIFLMEESQRVLKDYLNPENEAHDLAAYIEEDEKIQATKKQLLNYINNPELMWEAIQSRPSDEEFKAQEEEYMRVVLEVLDRSLDTELQEAAARFAEKNDSWLAEIRERNEAAEPIRRYVRSLDTPKK